MKFLIPLMLVFSQISAAHEGHEGHEALKAKAPLPGASVFQLDSEWKNQNGEKTKLSELRGKPRLVAMLYTRCDTACPLIAEDLKETAAEAGGKTGAAIFSLDSFRETPESLKAFAKKRKLPPEWELFTADADAVAGLAAALGVRYKRLPNGDFLHSNVIYLLNAEGEIVAQKEGIKSPRAEFVKKIKMEAGRGSAD
jgi:protein SCO1/2